MRGKSVRRSQDPTGSRGAGPAQPHSAAPRRKLGVVGMGAVGRALAYTLGWFHDIVGYDKIGNYDWGVIPTCEAVFVCVSTPEGTDGRLDCSNVDNVLDRLESDSYRGLVIIRSTLRVGFMDGACRRHPGLRLVYSPEFLRERSRFQWSVNPDRLVIAGRAGDSREVQELFAWAENCPTLMMSYTEAEIGKLAHNAFIATKVSFTNEIEEICRRFGADATLVMSVVSADRRVQSNEHLRPDLGPYGGMCVPKDTHELALAGGNSVLLGAVEEVNKAARKRTKKRVSNSK